MIDRAALKLTARQSMRGKKPSAFLVAAIYILIITVFLGLISALAGSAGAVNEIQNILMLEPNPTFGELASAVPPLSPFAVILIIAIFAVKLIIDVGYMGYCLKVSRNEEAELGVIFDSFALFMKIICLELLQILFIALWSLLLIVPGIVACYKYRLAFYILLDNPEAGPLECLRESKRMMNGYKAELLFLDLSFLGWFLTDIAVETLVVFRLFSIWLAPYVGITRAGFYNLLAAGDGDGKDPE